MLGLVHLLRHRAVALGHIGGALVLVGIVGYTAVLATELVLLQIAQTAADRGQMVALAERIYASVGFGIFLLMFLVGLLLGLIVLAVALWRARIVPLWIAGVIALASVLDMVGSTSAVAVVIVWVLLLIGLGWVGLKVLRMSDAGWAQASTPTA